MTSRSHLIGCIVLTLAALPSVALADDYGELDKYLGNPQGQQGPVLKPAIPDGVTDPLSTKSVAPPDNLPAIHDTPIFAGKQRKKAESTDAPPFAPNIARTAPTPPPVAAKPFDTRVLQATVPNIRVVNNFMLRGGQPDARALANLKAAGVKTVVDLRNEEVLVREEAGQCRALGLQFISIPLDVFNAPSEASISKFLAVTDSAQNRPIYVHCLHGQDRTGTMVALYRIEREGWDPNQAYGEMVSCGFRQGFSNLSQTVFAHGKKLGRTGSPPSGGDIIDDIKKRFRKKSTQQGD